MLVFESCVAILTLLAIILACYFFVEGDQIATSRFDRWLEAREKDTIANMTFANAYEQEHS